MLDKKVLLCVNIDHIATIREARKGIEPNIVQATSLCEEAGADGITVHLREDRRHIQTADLFALKEIIKSRFTLEMSASDEILEIAKKIKPDLLTIVPEKRAELTTEGGLNLKDQKDALCKLQKASRVRKKTTQKQALPLLSRGDHRRAF